MRLALGSPGQVGGAYFQDESVGVFPKDTLTPLKYGGLQSWARSLGGLKGTEGERQLNARPAPLWFRSWTMHTFVTSSWQWLADPSAGEPAYVLLPPDGQIRGPEGTAASTVTRHWLTHQLTCEEETLSGSISDLLNTDLLNSGEAQQFCCDETELPIRAEKPLPHTCQAKKHTGLMPATVRKGTWTCLCQYDPKKRSFGTISLQMAYIDWAW